MARVMESGNYISPPFPFKTPHTHAHTLPLHSHYTQQMGETLTLLSLLLLLLLLLLFVPHSRALPMAIIVPDPSSSSSSSPPLAAPPLTAGGDLPALPSDRPAFAAAAPSSVAGDGAASPEVGGGIPFISSNPAVPIPTGVTDSSTILPLPSPNAREKQVAGSGPSIKEGTAMMVLGLMLLSIGLVLETFMYLGTAL